MRTPRSALTSCRPVSPTASTAVICSSLIVRQRERCAGVSEYSRILADDTRRKKKRAADCDCGEAEWRCSHPLAVALPCPGAIPRGDEPPHHALLK